MLTASEMRGDSHTPPDDWDYSKGAWVCSRHGCGVQFATRAAFVAARSAFLVAKADKSREGKDRAAAHKPRCMLRFTRPTKGSFSPRAQISTWQISSSTLCIASYSTSPR
mmetsp:Transcript_9658/g.24774  ORF Transcript_9658/g.24774 Transcript_9658/m.24774 type:complete len:110 (+) Transcript_9658:489-818(+)